MVYPWSSFYMWWTTQIAGLEDWSYEVNLPSVLILSYICVVLEKTICWLRVIVLHETKGKRFYLHHAHCCFGAAAGFRLVVVRTSTAGCYRTGPGRVDHTDSYLHVIWVVICEGHMRWQTVGFSGLCFWIILAEIAGHNGIARKIWCDMIYGESNGEVEDNKSRHGIDKLEEEHNVLEQIKESVSTIYNCCCVWT